MAHALTVKADTLELQRLLQETRASMGSALFYPLVDSLGAVANTLATSKDARVQRASAQGLVMYKVFASWRACFRGQYADAIRLADVADQLLGDRNDSLAIVARRYNLSARMAVYSAVGDTAQWRALHVANVRVSRMIRDTLSLLNIYGLSNNAGFNSPELEPAIAYARECIAHGSDSIAVRAHWYLGRLLWETMRYAEAIPHIRQARPFAMDGARNAWMPPFYHQVLGECEERLGHRREAMIAYDSCMQVSGRGGLPAWYCGCAFRAANLQRELGHDREAEGLFRAALDTAQAHGDLGQIAAHADALLGLKRSAGSWEEALRMSDLYHAAKDSLNNSGAGRELAAALFAGELRADSLAHTAELDAQRAEVRHQRLIRNGALGGSALLGLCAIIFLFQRVRIAKEKKRSDELLLNILPEEVARELKATGSSATRHIEQATILFTDFKGFTEAGEVLTPQELVEELDTCFKAFDAIITERGIEKIKTIGDAYMAAGGLQRMRPSGVAGVVHAALDMQDFMLKRKAERTALGKPAFDMRVGIHTGPVVAGIVGVKKFQYDIWGDTVNTASRMESSGDVGRVNISESTYREIASHREWSFVPRGKVKAKGKGELEMYFVSRSLG